MEEEKVPTGSDESSLFDRMAGLQNPSPVKKFQRSKKNNILAGVCGGIAEYTNEDPARIRLIALMSLLLGGWGAAAYLIAAMLMPAGIVSSDQDEEENESLHREHFSTVLGGTMIVAGIYFSLVEIGFPAGEYYFLISNRFVFSAAALIIGVLILTGNWRTGGAKKEINKFNFTRSREKKMIWGVCAGAADYLKIDLSIIRIIVSLTALLTLGLTAIIYIILGIFIPLEGENKLE